MRHNFFLAVIAILFFSLFRLHAQVRNIDSVWVSGEGDERPSGYVPPLVSNGSISMLIDNKGGQDQREYVQMIPGIYWAGRRYQDRSDPITHRNDELIPFGHFNQEWTINDKPSGPSTGWSQMLDTKEAKVLCKNDYGGRLSIETTVFIPLNRNMIVVHHLIKTHSNQVRTAQIKFNYQFSPPGHGNRLPRKTISKTVWNSTSKSADFLYQIDGYNSYEGVISVFSDHAVQPSVDGPKTCLKADLDFSRDSVKRLTFYILLADSMDTTDYLRKVTALHTVILKKGYDSLLASHMRAWKAFYDESFVHIPDRHMEEVYHTAQYHLRANATRWSFPVGIFPTHWAGKYFGWDEMFCFQALASSNHLSVSRRVPDFRFAGLAAARQRVSHYNNAGKYGARFPWESLEDGSESTPTGFWQDHVFQMSNIGLSSWFQYLYTSDTGYLRSVGYPVMLGCARFYASHMVYKNADGSMFVGKCTDLERLGPAIQNPFMTSCGIIYTLETTAKAARILKEDLVEANDWEIMAKKLRENLPRQDGRYIPYLGCKEESVASLGGLFPYPVFNSRDSFQRRAVYHFLENASKAGNMYPVGKGISAWYAGWLAAALDLLGDKNGPAVLLANAAEGAGLFSELFEINEPKISMHPWFSTASGNYIYALNQMLLQSNADQILIAPAVPDSWNDFSFKLACHGNIVIVISVKNGKLENLDLIPGDSSLGIHRTIVLPRRLFDKHILNQAAESQVEYFPDVVKITVKFKGTVHLLNA